MKSHGALLLLCLPLMPLLGLADSLGPSVAIKTTHPAGLKASAMAPPSAIYTIFDYDHDTVIGPHPEWQKSGCGCGLPYKGGMRFSPNPVLTRVGQAVTVRYDASQICNKQTIKDLNRHEHAPVNQIGTLVLGHATWETGVVSDLPLEWGILTYSGYSQGGDYAIEMDIRLQCYDRTNGGPRHDQECLNTCETTLTVPVHVDP